jgi:uncharacterized protein (TIGR02996 family)
VPNGDAFFKAIANDPEDGTLRLVYADWLEECGDPRGEFLRTHLALRSLPPDHPQRPGGEQALSRLRKGLDPGWLAVVEPERAHFYEQPPRRPSCPCFQATYFDRPWTEVGFHREPQDTECDAWKRLLDLVEQAARDGREEFAPIHALDPDDWGRIVTLPPTIAKLKAVRRLVLYGSHLVRIPPEIAGMTALEEFDPYTSYRLHWFPYEITRCLNLRDSRVSTRALYGNYKYRPPFPRLRARRTTARDLGEPEVLPPAGWRAGLARNCSVCDRPFEDRQRHRVWISLWVATDVLPLLVNACSEDCVGKLPQPAQGYVQQPHRGGLEVQQSPPYSR